MNDKIHGYIIGSVREHDRIENIHKLQMQLPLLQFEEAVYPAHTKVPFMRQLLDLSYVRTGYRLNEGELGCLLSHRNVWRKIVQRSADQDELFLVLESDSNIQNLSVVEQTFKKMVHVYDLFFWGAWDGHMKLFRSTKQQMVGGYSVGTPFIKTVYCTYGYSLNKKAAAYLLQQTKKIAHPVDQFKYLLLDDSIRIGGVMPELITTNGMQKSYIRAERNKIKEFLFRALLDMKNSLICYFK